MLSNFSQAINDLNKKDLRESKLVVCRDVYIDLLKQYEEEKISMNVLLK